MASLFVQLQFPFNPSKVEWDLTNGTLSKLLELRYSGVRVRSVGPVGDFLDSKKALHRPLWVACIFFCLSDHEQKVPNEIGSVSSLVFL